MNALVFKNYFANEFDGTWRIRLTTLFFPKIITPQYCATYQ